MTTPSTYMRIQGIDNFDDMRRRGTWASWWHWLLRRPATLLSFAEIRDQLPTSVPFDRGVQDIPVTAIAGSVGRARDFDRSFRPLNNTLRDRWVNIYYLHYTIGWEPIVVYKVGSLYFVEDGHHRVSVAQAAGVSAIEARVYEYPVPANLTPQDTADTIVAKLQGACEPASGPRRRRLIPWSATPDLVCT